MAELVDAHVSGACIERCAGSSPVPGTKGETEMFLFFCVLNRPCTSHVAGQTTPTTPDARKEDLAALFLIVWD